MCLFFGFCLLAACLLPACCLLVACLLLACCLFAACLLFACRLFATCLPLACRLLVALCCCCYCCLLLLWLLFVFPPVIVVGIKILPKKKIIVSVALFGTGGRYGREMPTEKGNIYRRKNLWNIQVEADVDSGEPLDFQIFCYWYDNYFHNYYIKIYLHGNS